MSTEHQLTREEEAYKRLVTDTTELLSEVARTIRGIALGEAHAVHMVHNYNYMPEEYEEAMDKMRLASVELTGRDCELLSKLWRAGLAVAASIDPEDETPAGHRVYRGDVHRYHRMWSGMVEQILSEKNWAAKREKEIAEQEPEDYSDCPF